MGSELLSTFPQPDYQFLRFFTKGRQTNLQKNPCTIKNIDLIIDPQDPFTNDCLDRRQNIVDLTNLIRSSDQPFVLSIEAPWGWGKTTFVRLWKAFLEQDKNYPCLYFNAWSNDFAEDPLVAFLSEMSELLEKEEDEGKNQALKKALRKAQKIGGGIFRRGLPLVIRLTSQGIINEQSLSILRDAGSEFGDLLEQAVEDRIKAYEQEKKGIKAFRESLEEFAKLAANGEEDKRPVVFFVDELDRCRPDYAVALLERIKHLFNVERVVFVLSIDRQQIISSIKSIYGNTMDADGYLRRFIDISYRLPEPPTEAFCKMLFNRYRINEVFEERKKDTRFRQDPYEEEYLRRSFVELTTVLRCSLRVQEQCLTEINIVLRTTGNRYMLNPLLLSFLVVIKAYKPDFYEAFHDDKVDVEELIKTVKELIVGTKFLERDYEPWVTAYVIGNFCREQEPCKVLNDLRTLAEANDSSVVENMERRRAVRILELITHLESINNLKALSYVMSRIDNIGKFLE